MLLKDKQEDLDPTARDYSYIEYYRRSVASEILVKLHEGKRDYFSASLRQVNHLVQIGEPNIELLEAKWELYKVSISFEWRKFHDYVVDDFNDVPRLKGSKHRVFFQNAEGNINMGVFFNDPDVGLDEIFWYDQLAEAINLSLVQNEGLISVDEELNTRSCYVELHRKS